MDTLEIRAGLSGAEHNWLASSGPFDALAHFDNRYRDIIVDDPDDPYGAPIYAGIAVAAGHFLPPGTYNFWWNNAEED